MKHSITLATHILSSFSSYVNDGEKKVNEKDDDDLLC